MQDDHIWQWQQYRFICGKSWYWYWTGGFRKHTTANGNSLGDVNQLHQTLKDLVRSKHGISTRHLPGYLNWIAYLKGLKYSSDRDQIAGIVYNDLCTTEARFLRDDVSRTEQPISLYEAYKEYQYGIYSAWQDWYCLSTVSVRIAFSIKFSHHENIDYFEAFPSPALGNNQEGSSHSTFPGCNDRGLS